MFHEIILISRDSYSMAPTVPFGRLMRQQHFLFADGHIPLNGGSFGTFPRSVKAAADRLRDQTEQRPDRFLFHDFESLLSESRFLVAKLLNVQTDEVVIVPNASTASDTVMRNIVWAPGDVFLTIASGFYALLLDISKSIE